MRVGILAAGVGRRLGGPELPPKILLEFDGLSLLARHVALLRHCGIERIDLVVGYRAGEVEAEIARIGARGLVTTHFNAQFEQGSILSLATLDGVFTAGEPVVFMDGDVLYDYRMMERLVHGPGGNRFLMDRTTEEGEDPVRMCMRDGVLVDFHKWPERAHDWWGEWVGFCRLAPDIAAKVAAAAKASIESGRLDIICETAFRGVLLREAPGTFAVEDITGLPWIEIDFPEDLERAGREILPRLIALTRRPERRRAAGDR